MHLGVRYQVRGIRLGAPVAEIQKVITDGAVADLGDRRLHAFELVTANARGDGVDKFFIEACFHRL